MGRPIINLEIATKIKTRVWNGEAQLPIAADYSCTQATISHVTHGRLYYAAKWPDGTEGPLPKWRSNELHKQRYPNVQTVAIKAQLGRMTKEEFGEVVQSLEDGPSEEIDLPLPWDECLKIISDDKVLVKQTRKDKNLRAFIACTLGTLPPSQRTIVNVKRLIAQQPIK